MVKTIVKIVLALLILHGVVRVGLVYWNYYRFEDSLQQLAQFGERRTEKQLCDEALETAANYGIPIGASGVVMRRGNNPPYNCETGPLAVPPGNVAQPSAQMSIEAYYMEYVPLLPGYTYPWEFKPSVKAFTRVY
jgi:hypothetical protein